MAERKSVSMQDLADKLGISKVTVSKALNGKDGVGEELKEKIFALARESGYVLPDYGKRKSKKVGIIMSPRFSSGDEGNLYGNVRADHLRAAESILLEYHDFSDNSNTPVGHEHDTDQRAVRRPDLSWYSR